MSSEKLDLIVNTQNLLLEKVDNLQREIVDIKIVQVEQAKDIKHHIERTDLLEEIITPLNQKYQQGYGIIKFLGASSVIFGLVIGLKTLLSWIGFF